MQRNVLILLVAVIVAVGVGTGVLLAGTLPSGPLQGAFFDDEPGPWLYAPNSIVGDPGLQQLESWQGASADALFVVEQRHEQLATAAGGTMGADCYIVAPCAYNPYKGPSYVNQYFLFGGRRADLLVLASSVEAAPGELEMVTSSNPLNSTYMGGCVPVGQGVPTSVSNADLVGTTIVRNSDVPWTCGDMTDYTSDNVGYLVLNKGTVTSGGLQVNVFQVRPGYRLSGTWHFWDEKTLNAPVEYVRANFHPI
jgi:hypothetical protein